ncbi:MAG TPA: hypothetical protein PLN69_10330 [bacterium]|nr:hypothetical protein [bacterium]
MRFYILPHRFQVFYDEYDLYNSARIISDNHDVRWCKGGTFSDCEITETPIWF